MICRATDVGLACIGKHTQAELVKAIIDLAEPAPLDGYSVIPEVVASSDDPHRIALILLLYGTVVIESGRD